MNIYTRIQYIFLALVLLASPIQAAECETDNYLITITEHCGGTNMTDCDNVIYHGVNIKTKKAITLRGSRNTRPCSDGVTPCQVTGWSFRNGEYTYELTNTQQLFVMRNGQVITEERCIRMNWD